MNDRLIRVKFDTDYVAEMRRVRVAAGRVTAGDVVDVEVIKDADRWQRARVERWLGKTLCVTTI